MKQLQYTWLRSLMGAYEDFWQVTGNALDHALEFHGVADKDVHARLMDLYKTLDAYPDAAAALDRLKSSGYATAILSNGSPDMLDAAVTSAGLGPKLDHVMSVHDLGVYKPDMRVYQLVLDTMFIQKRADTVKVRPDHKLVFQKNWEDPTARARGVKRLIDELAGIAQGG